MLAVLSNNIVETANDFFDSIHTWMPIISKKRVDSGVTTLQRGSDTAMLFLAMRLIISTPPDNSPDVLHRLAKEFLSSLEAAGIISHLCLQAMILVALYEYSHGIYPAAWMTVGACARYAELLGISCSFSKTSFAKPCVRPSFPFSYRPIAETFLI